jgi:hypothetical protein
LCCVVLSFVLVLQLVTFRCNTINQVVAAARADLIALYSKYKPEFLDKVEGLLTRFAGIEIEFVQ